MQGVRQAYARAITAALCSNEDRSRQGRPSPTHPVLAAPRVGQQEACGAVDAPPHRLRARDECSLSVVAPVAAQVGLARVHCKGFPHWVCFSSIC